MSRVFRDIYEELFFGNAELASIVGAAMTRGTERMEPSSCLCHQKQMIAVQMRIWHQRRLGDEFTGKLFRAASVMAGPDMRWVQSSLLGLYPEPGSFIAYIGPCRRGPAVLWFWRSVLIFS
jgi:hypothetical protein